MIARVWRARIKPGRGDDYERFARERSTPVFEVQRGFLGVVMYRRDEDCFVITFWTSKPDADAVGDAADYLDLVRAIGESSMLAEQESLGSYDAHQLKMLI